MDAWPQSSGEALHTSTTLGNPLGCAMTWPQLPSTSKRRRNSSLEERADASTIAARELALDRPFAASEQMLGVELVKRDGSPYGALAAAIMRRGLQDGLILLGGGPAGAVLSFAPPLSSPSRKLSSWRQSSPTTWPSSPAPFRSRGRAAR